MTSEKTWTKTTGNPGYLHTNKNKTMTQVNIPTGQALIDAVKAIAKAHNLTYWPGIFEPGHELALATNYCNYTNLTGETLTEDQVQDISHQYTGTYEDFEAWVTAQVHTGNTFYYSEPRESFSEWEAIHLAAKLGKTRVIMEDLS